MNRASRIFVLAVFVAITTPVVAPAATIESLNCTPPLLIVTFDSAVSDYDASAPTVGLTSLKFKESLTSSNAVNLSAYLGKWNSARTVFTSRPSRKNYENTYGWNPWTLTVQATADASTSQLMCN